MVTERKSDTSKPHTFVARAILCLIFGFFIYETINEFNKLFGLSLNPYFAIVLAVLVYVVQEFVIKKLRGNEKAVPNKKPMERKMDMVFYFIAWIFLAIFFLLIFVVWAGVIYKGIIKNV
ncbi:MAG: hypothetical protein PVI53_16190 [Desulfobacteraceae bacterium]|jgi:membrane protein insertase Oxa1/YidC/SpoIIIJ